MAAIDTTPEPALDNVPNREVLGDFRHLRGHTLEAALLCADLPPGTPLSIAMVRRLLDAGTHLAGRVLRELVEGSLAAVRHIRDAAGRILGRRTEWLGPNRDDTATPEPPAPAADEPTTRALALLRSLACVDARLTFAERELRGLAPLVLARLDAGESEDALRHALSRDLPPHGRHIGTGLLHYRLTKGGSRKSTRPTTPAEPVVLTTPASPAVPAQTRGRVMVECADCGRPGPTLAPGDVCDRCPASTEPLRLADIPELPALMARFRRVREHGPTRTA